MDSPPNIPPIPIPIGGGAVELMAAYLGIADAELEALRWVAAR
jgi:hypothetical protein